MATSLFSKKTVPQPNFSLITECSYTRIASNVQVEDQYPITSGLNFIRHYGDVNQSYFIEFIRYAR